MRRHNRDKQTNNTREAVLLLLLLHITSKWKKNSFHLFKTTQKDVNDILPGRCIQEKPPKFIESLLNLTEFKIMQNETRIKEFKIV